MIRRDPYASMATCREGAEAAAHILLHQLRMPIQKARMTLASPKDFDLAVARLAEELQARADEPQRTAVTAALGVLDVDWPSTTP